MKWYKHDSNANADAKLKKVRMKYGMEGYGLYWYCLELICDGIEAHNLTFNLEHDSEIIAHDTGIHYERVQEMMSYMVNLELFEMNQGIITCMKMAKRLDMSMTSKPAFRKSIQEARGNHDRVMTGSGGGHELEENRIEENKNLSPPAPTFNFKNSLVDCGVEQKNIIAWMAVRKKKKAVNSEVAFDGFLREVEISGLSYNQAVQMSAENSWSGFKAEWANKDRGKSNGTYQTANEKAADRMRHTRDYATATNF